MKYLRFFVALLVLSLAATCLVFTATAQTTTQITIDGDPADWSNYNVLFTDPAGDYVGGGFDIASVRVFANDRFFYLLIETHGPRHNYVQIDLELETGGRRFIVSFRPEEGGAASLGEVTTGEFIAVGTVTGSLSAAGQAVEFKMPLSAFESDASLVVINIHPMAGDCCMSPDWYPVDQIETIAVPQVDEVEPVQALSISGQVVQAATGNPLRNAIVEIIDATRSLEAADGWYWPRIASTETNDEGDYSFGAVPTSDYWIIAYADGYAREVYDQQVSIHEAPVVSYGGTPIHGINFALNEAGTILGRITEADGVTPIPNIMVQVALAKYAWLENRWYTAMSSADGTYTTTFTTLSGLPPSQSLPPPRRGESTCH